jgi:hypothetical protein
MLWGVWGGRAPGAWCFGTAYTGNRWCGTREEAEALVEEFRLEQEGRPDAFMYAVAEFDASREPEAQHSVPTPAQWNLLDVIRRHGTINVGGLGNYRGPLRACGDRGWYCMNFTPDGHEAKPDMRLTRAGNAAWSDGAARGYTQTLDISWV